MDAPSEELRSSVAALPDSEQGCEQALDIILQEMSESKPPVARDGDAPDSERDRQFTVIDTWASLVSYAVARTYAPHSPMPWPGWSMTVGGKLTALITHFRAWLLVLARSVGGVVFSIGLNFPWGLQLTISWTS